MLGWYMLLIFSILNTLALFCGSGQLLFISVELNAALAFVFLLFSFLSFCASGAQVAFFSLSFKDINLLKTKPQMPYRRIVRLLEQPKLLQGALVVANVFVNIGLVIIANFFLSQYLLLSSVWLSILVKLLAIAAFLLLVVEILPRTLAAQNNIRFAKDVSWVVEGIHLLFNRLAGMLLNFADGVEKSLGPRSGASSLDDLHHAIDLTTESDATEDEKNILKGIINLGNITVKQVMRARLDVNGIDFNLNFDQLKKRIEDLHYSRLPVFESSLDDIRGLIHSKDLVPYLAENARFDWHSLMRPAYFVHEQKLIEDLLKEFQQKRIHFAVVADEFGGTSGIITLEDILEEVIGEIADEFDEEEAAFQKIDDLNYVFEGKTMLNDVCRAMNLDNSTFDDVKGESDSLAGLILELAGEIPTPNQVVSAGDFDFLVMEVDKNRIQKVKISIKNGQ
jgi:putative hemolysin